MGEDTKLRYSKVTRRMWNDAKVRRLSWPPPNGLTLWQRLLTGPELNNIPGLIATYEGGLANALRWDIDGFRHAFAEVMAEGLAEADWEAGLVWVPKAIQHNPPTSLNVVIGWRSTFDDLPDCPLKFKALRELDAFVHGMSKAFGDAFDHAFAKAKAIQEQDQDTGAGAGSREPPAGARTSARDAQVATETAQPVPMIEPVREPPTTPPSAPTASSPRLPDPFGDEAIAEAWAQGIAASRGPDGKCSTPRGEPLKRIVAAVDAHGPPRGAGLLDRVAFVRRVAEEYGRASPGKITPFAFEDWLNSGGTNARTGPPKPSELRQPSNGAKVNLWVPPSQRKAPPSSVTGPRTNAPGADGSEPS